MCDKTVDNYTNELEFVPDCNKTPEMCKKAVNTYPSTIYFFPECCMAQVINV